MALVLVDNRLSDDRGGRDLVGRGCASGEKGIVAGVDKCLHGVAVDGPGFVDEPTYPAQPSSESRARGGRGLALFCVGFRTGCSSSAWDRRFLRVAGPVDRTTAESSRSRA